MAMYATGTAAAKLGLTRDSLQYHLRTSAPKVGNLYGGRRLFTDSDIEVLRTWFTGRRKSDRCVDA